MSIVPQNFQSYLTSLRVIFIALLMGQVTALAVLYVVREQNMPDPLPDSQLWLLRILPVVLAALVVISFSLHRNQLANARAHTGLKEKLGAYRTALILRWAPLEALTLLIAVFYFLTGTMTLVYLAGALLILFAAQWPNRTDLVNALRLPPEEQLILDDPHAEVSDLSRRP